MEIEWEEKALEEYLHSLTLKTWLIGLFAIYILFFLNLHSVYAYDWDDLLNNPCTKTLLNLDPPPMIYDVSTIPDIPLAGKDVLINAAIQSDPQKTDAVTVKAWLHYSIDQGKTLANLEMQTTKNKKGKIIRDIHGHILWTAVIPGQEAGKTVTYYISAKDDFGNFSTETSGTSVNGNLPPDATTGTGPLLSVLIPDEECKDAEAGLDILGLAFGYDDTMLYGAITTRGPITEGTPTKMDVKSGRRVYLVPWWLRWLPIHGMIKEETTPTLNIHTFGIGLLNPDQGEDTKKASGIVWSPLWTRHQGGSWIQGCFALNPSSQKTHEPVPVAVSGAQCTVVGDTLYFKLSRSLFGPNPSGILRVVAFSGYVPSLESTSFLQSPSMLEWLDSMTMPLSDATPHVYVYFRTHSYIVLTNSE